MRTVSLPNPDTTQRLGEALGRAAFAGCVIALSGDLGAGKTSLAQGIARGLGVPGRVQSPTFVLVMVHDGGRLPLWHADLYRLADEDDAVAAGIPERFDGVSVGVIEWAERFPELMPADRLEVEIVDDGEGRRATLAATGPRHAALEAIDAPA